MPREEKESKLQNEVKTICSCPNEDCSLYEKPVEVEGHCPDNKCSECGTSLRRSDRTGKGTNEKPPRTKGLAEFTPPESGDSPEDVKKILESAYTSCRQAWVDEHPDDEENEENKTSCAKIAWSAVEKAGWSKDEEGKWAKSEAASEECLTCGQLSGVKELSVKASRDVSSTRILQGSAIQSLFDKYPPEEGAEAWVVFRKRVSYTGDKEEEKGWFFDQILYVDTPTPDLMADIFWEGELRLFKVNPEIGSLLTGAIIIELPEGGEGFKVVEKKEGIKLSEELFKESPRNPYGSHASFGYPGGKDGWTKAWKNYMATWPVETLNGTRRRVTMIVARMTGCSLPTYESVGARTGPKPTGGWKQKPSDYNMTKWKKPSDDDVDREKAIQMTCQDLIDIYRMAIAEMKRQIKDREEEEKKKKQSLSDGVCENIYDMFQPKLQTLSEEEAKRTGKTKLLMIDTTLIAKGTWKGVEYSEDVVKDALERATNLRIDIEHEDETWEDVKGFSYKPRWNESLKGIDVQGAIFDERVIEWSEAHPNEKIGVSAKLSTEAKFKTVNGKKICTYLDFKGMALTLSPACKVCWLKSMQVVELSSSTSNEEAGGAKPMTEEEKKKLAEDKKPENEEEENKGGESKDKEEMSKDKSGASETAPAKSEASTENAVEKSTAELSEELAALKKDVETLKAANETLSNERSLSEAKQIVDGLVACGSLSEAKRGDATKAFMALSDDASRAAFLSCMDGREWEAGETGIVLSEEEKKSEEVELSEPERGVIT